MFFCFFETSFNLKPQKVVFPTGDLSSDAKVSSSIGFSEEVKNGLKKQKKQKQKQRGNEEKICGEIFRFKKNKGQKI